MSDAQVFDRFIHEFRSLLGAIETHAFASATGVRDGTRDHALSEMERLARAAASLAGAFGASDIVTLTEALVSAAQLARTSDTDGLLSPPGSLDAVAYLRWRVDWLATAGHIEPPTAADEARREALLFALQRHAGAEPPTSGAPGIDQSRLTPQQRALIDSFANLELRPRDDAADARALARVTGAPIFMAQTHGGAEIPVYGGLADDEDEDEEDLPPEMRLIFVPETTADLRTLSQIMAEFERRPDDDAALARMGFIAHKMKGSAATMRFKGFAAISLCFQDAIKAAQSRATSTDTLFLLGFGRFLEFLEQALVCASALEEPPQALVEDAKALLDLLQRPQDAAGHVPHPQALGSDARGERGGASAGRVLHVETHKLDQLMNQLGALAANRGAVARELGDITQAQAEMQAALTRLREKSAQIADSHPLTFDNLQSTLHTSADAGGAHSAWPVAAGGSTATGGASGPLHATWNALQLEQYTEMDTALRALTEVVSDVTANYGSLNMLLTRLGQLTVAQASLTRDIQGDAMDIRLCRLSELTPRLRIAARMAASDLRKQIEFDVIGDDIEIDRVLLEKLEDPLIQLVRNAIAHGIESPAERRAAGKSERGRVVVTAQYAGTEVEIAVTDDGRGVNAQLLTEVAVTKGIITPEQAQHLTQSQALNLMFQIGVTTMETTAAGYDGALAGTGVGLADVENTVKALKGAISFQSNPASGSTFQIRAPISLSMLPILEVNAAGQAFALPFALVESTAIIEPGTLREAPPSADRSGTGLREWRVPGPAAPDLSELAGGDALPPMIPELRAYSLAETLGFEQDAEKLRQMVVVRLHDQTVALLVEKVGEGDVRQETVRPLPRRLQRRMVRGVIVRPENGDVALLIDPQEALAYRVSAAQSPLRPRRTVVAPRQDLPTVLVVDDSVTIRRTLEQMLSVAGYQVSVAHDGYEALEMMENAPPRVVILDVEMPRRSGFDVLKDMRQSPTLEHVKVAMLTSRAADKYRDHAMELGADAYLVKPCPQDVLIQTIERLLTESEPT